MPVFPLFHANNTFQWLKGAVKAGGKSEEAFPEKTLDLDFSTNVFFIVSIKSGLDRFWNRRFALI